MAAAFVLILSISGVGIWQLIENITKNAVENSIHGKAAEKAQEEALKIREFYLQSEKTITDLKKDHSALVEIIVDDLMRDKGFRDAVKGESGKPGKDGKDGDVGPQAEPGKDGRDGQPGKQGKPGKDSSDGQRGKPGEPGKDVDERKIIKEIIQKLKDDGMVIKKEGVSSSEQDQDQEQR